MNAEFAQNHFSLFGLEPQFALDLDALERSYREIQSRVHPDRHARSGDAARRAAMQWSTRVNEAYQTLRNPVERARCLLELNGVDAALETDTSMPADFLMRQMDLREALEDAKRAKDEASLEALHGGLADERESLVAALAGDLDTRRDYAGAALAVRKLMFLDKLDAEIDEAFSALEA